MKVPTSNPFDALFDENCGIDVINNVVEQLTQLKQPSSNGSKSDKTKEDHLQKSLFCAMLTRLTMGVDVVRDTPPLAKFNDEAWPSLERQSKAEQGDNSSDEFDDEECPIDITNLFIAKPSQQEIFLCRICDTVKKAPGALICPKCGTSPARHLLRNAKKLELGETIWIQNREDSKPGKKLWDTYIVKHTLMNNTYLLVKDSNHKSTNSTNVRGLLSVNRVSGLLKKKGC